MASIAVNNFYDSLNMQKIEGTEIFINLERKLRDNRWYKPMLDYAEISLNVNRVYLVLGAAWVLLLGLLLHYGVSLVTSGFGFIYPLYKTLSAMEKSNPSEEKKWLIYWLVHATLNFAETFLFFMHWLPGYWMLKCGFLYWCYAPIEKNGSDTVYSCMIQPFFLLQRRNQEVTDNTSHQEVVRTALPVSIYTDSGSELGKIFCSVWSSWQTLRVSLYTNCSKANECKSKWNLTALVCSELSSKNCMTKYLTLNVAIFSRTASTSELIH